MQLYGSLFVGTGAKGLFRPDRDRTRPQHVVGVHGYARIALAQRTGVETLGVGTRPAPDRGTPSGGGCGYCTQAHDQRKVSLPGQIPLHQPRLGAGRCTKTEASPPPPCRLLNPSGGGH